MKKVWILIALLFGVIGLTACTKEADQTNAYVTVDINPSFEIMTDDEGLIIDIIAANEDAAVVLYNLNIKGKKLDEGLQILVQESDDLGFIKGERNIVIGVSKQENKQALINHLHNKLREMKALKLKIHTDFKAGIHDGLKKEADAYNLSVAQYRHALRLRSIDAEVTFEAVKTMDIKTINAKIQNHMWLFKPLGEAVHKFDSYRDYQNRFLLRKARIVDALGTLILTTSPEYFDAYLGDSEIEAKVLVELYNDYLKALQRVIVPMGTPDYQEIIDLIEADSDYIQYKAELNQLLEANKVLIVSIKVSDKQALIEFESNLVLIKALKEKLHEIINGYIEDDNLIGFYHHGEIIIRPIKPENPYQQIREDYAHKFIDLGFQIETYEAHVLAIFRDRVRLFPTLQAEFEALINELNVQLSALKSLYLETNIEFELQIEHRHIYLKAQYQQKKGK